MGRVTVCPLPEGGVLRWIWINMTRRCPRHRKLLPALKTTDSDRASQGFDCKWGWTPPRRTWEARGLFHSYIHIIIISTFFPVGHHKPFQCKISLRFTTIWLWCFLLTLQGESLRHFATLLWFSTHILEIILIWHCLFRWCSNFIKFPQVGDKQLFIYKRPFVCFNAQPLL